MLFKMAEIYEGCKDSYGDYVEIFKNPTQSEYDELRSNYNEIRGLITTNGDIYAWDGEVLHSEIRGTSMPMKELHIAAYDNVLSIYTDKLEYAYNCLKKYEDKLKQFVGNQNPELEFAYLIYTNISFEEYFTHFENDTLDQLATNKKRLKYADFYDGFKAKGNYFEVFVNPTNSEYSELKSVCSDIRGILSIDGTIYAWPGEILHNEIFKLNLNIPDGLHIENSNGQLFVYTKSLEEAYKYIKNNISHIESFMQNKYTDISLVFGYFDVRDVTISDYIKLYEESKGSEEVLNKLLDWDYNVTAKLQKVNDKIYTWQEVCDEQSNGTGKASSLPFGSYGEFKLEEIKISSLSDYFMTFDEMFDMDLDEDINIVRKIASSIEKGDYIPPIVVDKNGKLIDGSHRLSAYYELGYYNIDAYIEV